MESLQAEVNINSSAISEEQAKQARLKDGLRLIEIELEIASSDKELIKRKKRIETALEESTQRMNEAQQRLNELNTEIATMRVDQERQRLIDMAEVDAQRYELTYRAKKLEKAMETLKHKTEPLTGYAGAMTPTSLLKDAGIKAGGFDLNNQAQAQHKEIWEELTSETNSRVDEEFEALMEAINRFLAQDK
jgi:chromosome segregation ATPase